MPIGLGATFLGDGCTRFCVWAPSVRRVEVHTVSPDERLLPLERTAGGYHEAILDKVGPGCLYMYRLDGGKERPDPASRSQPRGVHGPSEVVGRSFTWECSSWMGLRLNGYVISEIHVGTFSPEGTFDGAIGYLDDLKRAGITAVELMPVSQFPGARNWGYDGVYPYAAQDSYGGQEGLKRLVDACHQRGMAVLLDVVYNHLGPEGNYLADFGPYFTDRYKTPWGPAVNFDGSGSDGVRRFFVENALYWVSECRIDALRLDAVHAILDQSPRQFVEELGSAVGQVAEQSGRRIYVIAESHLNDARLIRTRELGGCGLAAVWNDDFHHALHALVTGERDCYYQDFGELHHLAKAFREGFVYSGEYAPFWRRRRGVPTHDIPAERFIVFAQNHDQIGNRPCGERLSRLVPFDVLKLTAGVVLLSPFVPLLFMGEEYGETAPFQYFISHSDPRLVEAVRKGRREEFAEFHSEGEPPDPQDEATFQRSKLQHRLRRVGAHRVLLDLHRELLRLRADLPALSSLSKEQQEAVVYDREGALFLRRWHGDSEVFAVFNFGSALTLIDPPLPSGRWRKLLDSGERRWRGGGSKAPAVLNSAKKATLAVNPGSFVLYGRDVRKQRLQEVAAGA